jgi:hypothetical protein
MRDGLQGASIDRGGRARRGPQPPRERGHARPTVFCQVGRSLTLFHHALT